ncbi:hypothetical protein Dvina_37025 [Dactylosporangium vinaceum]|uniref:Uncharacterized protein n=1 Tax=Dactylosporangium vinaceum TaxID=53362 RepID=A0ABV5MIS9_9ACTN|nr:hypothetical protein [Dactylosporangium vinaceum]UAB93773.1 hypothetical protein Dvina_37025 [Dactylosporangium vinaceum]
MIEIPGGPLPDDAVAGHETLYSQSQTLGPDGRPRLTAEGGVRFGRPAVYPLTRNDLTAMTRRRPDLDGRAFDIVEFPFDLDPLPGRRQYARADYVVTVTTAGVVARSLWPADVSGPADVDRARVFSVGADLAFAGRADPDGPTFRYRDLEPVITTRGLGQSLFGWAFHAPPGRPLATSSRRVFALLERAHDEPDLTGTLFVSTHVHRRTLPSAGPVEAHTRTRPFRLDTAYGTFTLAEPT